MSINASRNSERVEIVIYYYCKPSKDHYMSVRPSDEFIKTYQRSKRKSQSRMDFGEE